MESDVAQGTNELAQKDKGSVAWFACRISDSGVYAAIEARSEPLGMCGAHC